MKDDPFKNLEAFIRGCNPVAALAELSRLRKRLVGIEYHESKKESPKPQAKKNYWEAEVL